MARLIRTIRQNRWYKNVAEPFLAKGDVPADPIGDLRTTSNLLSVFEVSDETASVERVVCAVALGGTKVADTGYIVFDSDILESAGIETKVTLGTTADSDVNSWHRSLVVSGNTLVLLARGMLIHGQTDTVFKKRLTELVIEGINNGRFEEKCRSKI